MKKSLAILVLMCVIVSCDNDGRSTKLVVDSAVNKLESAAQKVGEKAENAWDTTKAKAKDLKDGLEKTVGDLKDTNRWFFFIQ